jgi:hypothetical protein
VNFEEEG